jgi:hypothetical protein
MLELLKAEFNACKKEWEFINRHLTQHRAHLSVRSASQPESARGVERGQSGRTGSTLDETRAVAV